jgi:putative DNA primase/helicase
MNTLAEAALKYRDAGIITHPLSKPTSIKTSPGKNPIKKGWSKITDPQSDKEIELNYENKGLNIGAVCGKASDLMVIDVDWHISGMWDNILLGVDTSGWIKQQRTNGRWHWLFKYDKSFKLTHSKALGMDLLGEAGNVVMSPSKHVSGDIYTLTGDIAQRPEMPSVVINRLDGFKDSYKALQMSLNRCRPTFSTFWKMVFEKATLGKDENKQDIPNPLYHDLSVFRDSDGRQRTLYLFAELKANGATKKELVLACMMMFGDSYNADTSTYEISHVNSTATAKTESIKADAVLAPFYVAGEKGSVAPIAESKGNGKDNGKGEDKKEITAPNCAREVLRTHPTFVMEDSLEFYLYQNGVYKNIGVRKNALDLKNIIRSTLIAMQGDTKDLHEASAGYVSAVLSYIEDCSHISRKDVNKNPCEIVVRNGILNVRTGILEPHNPSKIITVFVDGKYDPKATCHNFDGFLNSLFLEDGEHSINDQVDFVFEWIGYSLYMDYPLEKALMCIGEGGNGKGTMLHIITEFLGGNNTSHMSLEQIADQEKHPYRLAGLYGKLGNICGDMGNSSINNTEGFKKACGRDKIDCDVKYGSPFNFINHAKMAFAINEMPQSKDLSMGFFDRWVFLMFPKRFRGSSARDINIAAKCLTDDEKSGILNKAIKGLQVVLDNSRFSLEKTNEDIRTKWEELANPVAMFIDEYIIQNKDAFIGKDAVYAEYVIFCNDRGITFMHANSFKKKFMPACKTVGIQTSTSKRTLSPSDTTKSQVYANIAFA